jgi:hypothetical protein
MTRLKRLHLPVAVPLLALTFLLLSAGAAQAQSRLLRATIPFDFYTGGMLLPAGDYEVDRVVDGVLKIYSRETSSAVLVSTFGVSHSGEPQRHGELIFNRYGDDYVLSEMWWPYRTEGRKAVPSASERELAKTISPVRVFVALQ